MLAWERLHVLARNPIPPASSDNSLSASFPPRSCSPPPTTPPLSYPGADPRSQPTPPSPSPTPPATPSDRCARGATSESIYDPLSFPLFFVVLRASGDTAGVAFSNFPYAPTNLRSFARDRRKRRERLRERGMP